MGIGPVPGAAADRPFLMRVEDSFDISGRGTVVVGRIERGVLRIGDEVEIVGPGRVLRTVCAGLEMVGGPVRPDAGRAADVGVFLRGVARADVRPGDVLREPGPVPADDVPRPDARRR